MYKLSYFTEEDLEKVISFMKDYPFAVVTGIGEEYPVAANLPLKIEMRESGKLFLTGHMMRNTDHQKAFEKNEKVLVVFTGPNTYVSASWYENPAVASTWNYLSVHARGKISFTDEEGTYRAIQAITHQYEGNHSAASFEKLSREYVMKMIKAIVGFEIQVTTLDNVFKLSQNHTKETRNSIISHLSERQDENSKSIATEMEKRKDKGINE